MLLLREPPQLIDGTENHSPIQLFHTPHSQTTDWAYEVRWPLSSPQKDSEDLNQPDILQDLHIFNGGFHRPRIFGVGWPLGQILQQIFQTSLRAPGPSHVNDHGIPRDLLPDAGEEILGNKTSLAEDVDVDVPTPIRMRISLDSIDPTLKNTVEGLSTPQLSERFPNPLDPVMELLGRSDGESPEFGLPKPTDGFQVTLLETEGTMGKALGARFELAVVLDRDGVAALFTDKPSSFSPTVLKGTGPTYVTTLPKGLTQDGDWPIISRCTKRLGHDGGGCRWATASFSFLQDHPNGIGGLPTNFAPSEALFCSASRKDRC
jgi:hypothetical protein